MDRLAPDQAFRAMRMFLELQNERAPVDVAQVLSDTQMLPDGRSVDPAAWRDFLECVEHVLDQDRKPGVAAGE